MRVLVCGGRDYLDQASVFATLDAANRGTPISVVIHGGASGADRLGADWARLNGVEVVLFRADWSKYGKAAGPMRNRRMIDEGRPDLVIAFPGGKGTDDLVGKAISAGIMVMMKPPAK